MTFLSQKTLRRSSFFAVLLLVSAATYPLAQQGGTHAAATKRGEHPDAASGATAQGRPAPAYGKLPISFEPNVGQLGGTVQFLARGSGYNLYLTPGQAVVSLFAGTLASKGASNDAKTAPFSFSNVGLELIGADRSARAAGEDRLPGVSNYLMGKDPSQWHKGVPTFAKVRYSNIYPGIDLVYYGNREGVLEHDFVVEAGADPALIAMALHTGGEIRSVADKGIVIQTASGDLAVQEPVAYQVVDGARKLVSATYTVATNDQVSFHLGEYDKRLPLVIDPVLRYTATFGGTNGQTSWSIAVDSASNTYIAGTTASFDFPLDHPYEASCGCPGPTGFASAGFVTKINPTGTAFVYSTYFGQPVDQYDPNGKDSPLSAQVFNIAVDSAQRAYFAGYDPSALDNYVASFNAAGDSLMYEQHLPGTPAAIALDGSDNAYVTGQLNGTGFTPLHSIEPQGTMYVEKISDTGVLQYATAFGKWSVPGETAPASIAVDASGAAYVTGDGQGPAYTTTPGAYQTTCSDICAFVAKFSPAGSSLIYSTYLGGTTSSSTSHGRAIAVDSAGEVYVAGSAGKVYPVTKGAFQTTEATALTNGFVTKLNPAGSNIMYSTLLNGGTYSTTEVYAMALDQYRNVYVTGTTAGGTFPLKANISTKCGSGFLTTLSPNLSSIQYYSILAGGWAIAVDKGLNAYVTNFYNNACPATPGALQGPAGSSVSVTKIVIMDDIALKLNASPSPVAHGANLTYTLAATSNGPDFGYNVHIDDALPAGTTFVSYNAGGGSCTAPSVGSTGTLHCSLLQLDKGQTYTVTLTVKVNATSGTTLSNHATAGSNMQDYTASNNAATVTTPVN